MIFKPTAPNKILAQQRGPIGGLGDSRFAYVPHDKHTLDGFRARMEQYRAEMALKGK